MKIITGPRGRWWWYAGAGAAFAVAVAGAILLDAAMVKPEPWWTWLASTLLTWGLVVFGLVCGSKIHLYCLKLEVEQTCSHTDCEECEGTRL